MGPHLHRLLLIEDSFASFPMVFSQQYKQEPGPASLNFISLGVGFVIGLQISGPLIDKVSTDALARIAT